MNPNKSTWKSLTPVSSNRLFEARAQLHQAAQLLAAVGISFLKSRPDDSHTAMIWSSQSQQFLSQPLGEDGSLQVLLNPTNLSLSIQKNTKTIHEASLHGTTLIEGAADLQLQLDGLGLSKDKFTMQKHYELPDYPERNQTAFDNSDTVAFQVLTDSFSNAFTAFEAIRQDDSRSSDLLVWPHHFDLGLLITVATDELGNLSKSIGLGLSPGDGSYTSPYYYVTNWPAPKAAKLPAKLSSKGQWHTDYWVGMVLPLEPITSDPDGQDQREIVAVFLEESLLVANTFSKQI